AADIDQTGAGCGCGTRDGGGGGRAADREIDAARALQREALVRQLSRQDGEGYLAVEPQIQSSFALQGNSASAGERQVALSGKARFNRDGIVAVLAGRP